MIAGSTANIVDFGAKCDGVTDDTVAAQAAIDYCAANGWPALIVPGVTYITQQLNIDRTVDATTSEFFIRGQGTDGGFYTDQAINMFGTTFAITTFPISEFVVFQNINFEASTNNLACWVLDGNAFLRMRFSQCYFNKIRLLKSTLYVQSFYMDKCNSRFLKGNFIEIISSNPSTGQLYDFHWTDNIVEKGSLFDPIAANFIVCEATVGCSFHGGVFEGMNGSLLKAQDSKGLTVSGMYFEQNADIDIEIGFSRGSTVIGCYFYATLFDHYNISVSGLDFVGGGNFSNNKLYFDNMSSFNYNQGIISNGDAVEGILMYSLRTDGYPGDVGGIVGQKTCQLTGFASNILVLVTYRKVGRTVTVSYPTTNGTSTNGVMKLTGLYPALLPAGTIVPISVPVRDNGVNSMSSGRVTQEGIDFYATFGGPTATPFTASGSKGVVGTTFTYLI